MSPKLHTYRNASVVCQEFGQHGRGLAVRDPLNVAQLSAFSTQCLRYFADFFSRARIVPKSLRLCAEPHLARIYNTVLILFAHPRMRSSLEGGIFAAYTDLVVNAISVMRTTWKPCAKPNRWKLAVDSEHASVSENTRVV